MQMTMLDIDLACKLYFFITFAPSLCTHEKQYEDESSTGNTRRISTYIKGKYYDLVAGAQI